jgi:chaperonin GroES
MKYSSHNKKEAKDVNFLVDNVGKLNIADQFSDDIQQEIANKTMYGFDLDDDSRVDWKKQTEEGIKIAEQITEDKSYPWQGASNVKFPLIATSAIQFAARATPNILQGNKIVKARVVGEDKDGKKAERAERVANHMSFQLLEQMVEWSENTDQMLHSLPVVGTMFRKTYYDPILKRPISQLCMPLDVVVHMDTKSISTCRRISHIIPLYKNDVIERERADIFLDYDADYMQDNDDKDEMENFIEQHRWLDLDGDGYEEPYIVTVHQNTRKLVRIVANYDVEAIEVNTKGKVKRISAVEYFTVYFFIPSPSGKFYALGFAHLLGPINESMNTTINQMLDAGHMANLQAGWIGRGARIRGGSLMFKPGEWKQVDVMGGALKDNIVPLPTKEPSNVLFQLLGLLNDTGMKLASVSETMTGESPSQNTPATTTLAVLEQGMKVFTAIYQRIFRSLGLEFKKQYRLNRLYLDEKEYYRILDSEMQIFKQDYSAGDLDVIPLADPTLSSEAQSLARAEALMGTMERNPTPEGKMEILRQYYEAIKAEDIEKLLPMDEQGNIKIPPPGPDPEVLKLGLETTKAQGESERLGAKLPYEIEEIMAKIDELKSRTAKNLADAQDKPIQTALATITAQVNELHNFNKLEIERRKVEVSNAAGSGTEANAGGAGGVVKAPIDQSSPEILEGV